MNKHNVKAIYLIDKLTELGEYDLARRVAFSNIRTQILLLRRVLITRRVKKWLRDRDKHLVELTLLGMEADIRLTPPSE